MTTDTRRTSADAFGSGSVSQRTDADACPGRSEPSCPESDR
jgi:hypothetical protein